MRTWTTKKSPAAAIQTAKISCMLGQAFLARTSAPGLAPSRPWKRSSTSVPVTRGIRNRQYTERDAQPTNPQKIAMRSPEPERRARPPLREFDYVRAHNRVHAQYHSDRPPGTVSQDEGPCRNQVERGRPTAFGRTNSRLGEDGCPDPSKHAHARGR